MTTEERLKQYIDNDEVYQGYKNGNINLTDFEKFCIQHCKDIEEILEENKKMKNQQKEFIEWLENESKEVIRDAGYHQRICLDILEKYKEIIGDK